MGWVAIQGQAQDPVSNPPDPVLAWNGVMRDAIRLENSAPTLATRNLAILHTAIYDAVNAVTRTHQPFRSQIAASPGAMPEAAAVAAGYEVMMVLYPTLSTRSQGLLDSYRAAWTASAGITNGLALGSLVARESLESRAADGSSTGVPYIPSSDPGQWRRTPPFFRPPTDPQWGAVDPFCLPDVEPFVPPGPPALVSSEYAAAFNEVKELGAKNSATRTAEQTQIAVFWSDFSYTVTPPGHWDEIAEQIAFKQALSLADNARLFALLSVAQADAAIVCWEAKYRHNAWRPVTAIERADEDANPATVPDPNWNLLLNAPSFPEYTSGHSTFSKASAQVMTRFFGTDALPFTVGSDSLPNVFRSFASLTACVDEIGQSRIYGGIHFQFSNRDGKACGKRIGDYVSTHFLLSNDRLPLLLPDDAVTNRLPAFRLHGHVGKPCVLESSTDLRVWAPIWTNLAVSGGIPIVDHPIAGAPQRFYRAREL